MIHLIDQKIVTWSGAVWCVWLRLGIFCWDFQKTWGKLLHSAKELLQSRCVLEHLWICPWCWLFLTSISSFEWNHLKSFVAPVNSIANIMILWQTSGVFSIISGKTPNSAFQIGASCDELEVSYCRGYCLGTSEFVTIHQKMGVRIDIFAALCFRMPNDMCCMVLYPFHEVDGVISYMIMWTCSYQL